MPFGWVGFCDMKLAKPMKESRAERSPMPFGWVGFCDYWVVDENGEVTEAVSNAFRLGGVL